MNYADEIPFGDDDPDEVEKLFEDMALASRRAPRSPLDAMTVAAYEVERVVAEALTAFDPTGEIDVIANRFGPLWSVRPVTTRAAHWLTEWLDGEPVEPVFSAYCLPVNEDDIVPLLDALIDAGLRIG